MVFSLKAVLLTSSLALASGAVPTLQHRADNKTCVFNVDLETVDVADTGYVRMIKNVRLPTSGLTYRYAINPPRDMEKPYLFFLHGFPDSSYSWINQIEYFTRRGYGIIAPDLLGAGGTSKPEELEPYSFKNMAADLAELLDCEGIEKVVTVSHDLGSFLVSRFHTYQSKYISALAFMGIGYFAPGQDFNQTFVEVYNNITEAKLGCPLLGYWYYYNRPDGHVLMDTHLDSIYSLHFSHNMANDWIENVAKVDGLESWLAADRRAEYGNEWVTNTTRAQWQATTRAQGGVGSAQKWYKTMMRGINSADEDVGRSTSSGIIEQPTLFITAEKDPVAHPAEQLLTTVPYIPGLQIRTVDAGHFLQVEQAGEVNAHLNKFFESLRV